MALHRSDLRHLFRHELSVGQAVPGNIYDHAGRMLVPTGKVLRQEDLDLLSMTTLHVGPDWPAAEGDAVPPPDGPSEPVGESRSAPATDAAAKPQEIVHALNQQYHDGRPAREKRQHARHRWQVVQTLTLEEQCSGEARRRQIEVTTHDIAVAGFGFIYHQFIHPGTIITARFDSLPRKPWLRGVVRNCVNLGGVQHRVGVQFLEVCSEPAAAPRAATVSN